MCTIPPPPPPPQKNPEVCVADLNATPAFPIVPPDIDVCRWAADFPELQEACMRNRLCLQEPPYKYRYKLFQSILQEGPTCGLVAASMLINGKVPPSEILEIARNEGFTNNGEMFSCINMLKLIKKLFEIVSMNNCEIIMQSGQLYDDSLIEKLLSGSVLLVPYDADFNHTPCLKNGHKAHWSLVCGIIIENDPGESYKSSPDNIYVLCKHGKSKYLAAWSLKDLELSNKNLYEFLPRRGEQLSMYVMPEGGVGGDLGLKNKFIIINGLK